MRWLEANQEVYERNLEIQNSVNDIVDKDGKDPKVKSNNNIKDNKNSNNNIGSFVNNVK